MSLYTAHAGFYGAVNTAITFGSSGVTVSVGDRFQGVNGTEVIVQQLGGVDQYADEGIDSFSMIAYCFANRYTTCASIADTVYNALYDLSQGAGITGVADITVNENHSYHLHIGSRSMEYNDEDGYVAAVTCKLTKY